MAMTEEEVNALVAERDGLKKQLEEAKKPASPAGQNTLQEPDVLAKVKAAQEAQTAEKDRISVLEKAVDFNRTVESYLGEHKALLPALALPLFTELNKRTYTSPVVKAQVLQKSLLENFFSLKENVDALPKIMQSDLERFKTLADDEKEKLAGEFWKLIPLTLETKSLAKKAEEVKRANGGFVETNDAKKAYNERFFAKKSTYLGEQK